MRAHLNLPLVQRGGSITRGRGDAGSEPGPAVMPRAGLGHSLRRVSPEAPPATAAPVQRMVVQRNGEWPDSINAGGVTLKRKERSFVLYENDVKSAKAGNFHISIHIDPNTSPGEWDPSTHTLSGRLYVSKRTQLTAQIADDKAKLHIGSEDEAGAEEVLRLTQAAYDALSGARKQKAPAPNWAGRDSHLFRTTMHPFSIPLTKGEMAEDSKMDE